MCDKTLPKLKQMEILRLEKFHFTVFFTVFHMHSAFAVEYFFFLKLGHLIIFFSFMDNGSLARVEKS